MARYFRPRPPPAGLRLASMRYDTGEKRIAPNRGIHDRTLICVRALIATSIPRLLRFSRLFSLRPSDVPRAQLLIYTDNRTKSRELLYSCNCTLWRESHGAVLSGMFGAYYGNILIANFATQQCHWNLRTILIDGLASGFKRWKNVALMIRKHYYTGPGQWRPFLIFDAR